MPYTTPLPKDRSTEAIIVALISLFVFWPLAIWSWIIAGRTRDHYDFGRLTEYEGQRSKCTWARVISGFCIIGTALFLIFIAVLLVMAIAGGNQGT